MIKRKTNIIPGLIALFVIAIFAFLFTYDREWIGDDLVYQYVFGPDDAPVEGIESGADVMRSQVYHVMHINGRLPIHIIVQYFAGIFGRLHYAIANTLMFVVMNLLILRLCYGTFSIQNSMRVLTIGCILLFLFPIGTWYSLAMGINYLWVGVLYTIFLLVFFEREKKPRFLWAFVVLSFVLGWTNEAFAVPLSSAIFLIWVLKIKCMQPWHVAMICALWLGTLLIVLAPGTISRISLNNESNSMTDMIISLIDCYSGIWIFWLTGVLFVYCVIRDRIKTKQYVKENRNILIILAISVIFSIYAHTYSHSLTCIELLSLILLIRLWRTCDFRYHLPQIANGMLIVVLMIFGGAIAYCNHKSAECYRKSLQDLQSSSDGVFRLYTYEVENPIVQACSMDYRTDVTPSHYTAPYLAANQGRNDILPTMLSVCDYRDVIEEPDSFFIEKNRVPGSAHAYDGDWYYFIRCEKGDDESQYIAYFDSPDFTQNMSFVRRLVYKFVLNNKKAPKPLEAEVIHTRVGDYVILRKLLSVPSRIDVIDK